MPILVAFVWYLIIFCMKSALLHLDLLSHFDSFLLSLSDIESHKYILALWFIVVVILSLFLFFISRPYSEFPIIHALIRYMCTFFSLLFVHNLIIPHTDVHWYVYVLNMLCIYYFALSFSHCCCANCSLLAQIGIALLY